MVALLSRSTVHQAEQVSALFHEFRPALLSHDQRKQAETFFNYNLCFRATLLSHDVKTYFSMRSPQAPPKSVLQHRVPLPLPPRLALPPVPLQLAALRPARVLPGANARVGSEELVADPATPSTRHGRLRPRLHPVWRVDYFR